MNEKMNATLDNAFPKGRVHYAMLSFFLAQGLCFLSWADHVPGVKGISEVSRVFYWGLVSFLIPVGEFVAIPLAGYLVSKLGSHIMAQVSVLGYALTLFTIGTAHNIYLLGAYLFCFGMFWNPCDISLNTQGIGIERLYGRTIMALFHGGWSLAACLGALVGFVMIISGVTPSWRSTLIALLVGVTVLVNRKHSQEDVVVGSPEEEKEAEEKEVSALLSSTRKPETLLIQLSIVGLFALMAESAMFDWSGLYFESILQVPKSLQIGFLVFMVMMTVGRFLTDSAHSILGKREVLQLAGFFVLAGFFISVMLDGVFELMVVKVIVNSLDSILIGLGIPRMVPTIYSLVGVKSKTLVGIALTILPSISFIDSSIVPLLIGAISQAFNMKYAYIMVGLLGSCILLMITFYKAFKDN